MFTLDSINNLFSSTFSSFIKKGVSLSPHFVPLNLKLLNRSIQKLDKNGNNLLDVRKFEDSLFNYVKSKYSNTIILKSDTFVVNGKTNINVSELISRFTPALVFTNNNNKDNFVGVLFNSYNAAFAELLTEEIRKKIFNEIDSQLGDSELDLAYLFRGQEVTQESNSIKNFFGIFNSISNNTIGIPGTNIPNDKSGLIQSRILVESLLKDYAVYEERAFGTYSYAISKEVSNFVISIKADILIFHDTKFKEDIKKVIKSESFIDKIAKLLPNIKQTKTTFLQNVKNRIVSIFKGNKPTNIKESTKVSSKLPSKGKATVKLNETRGVKSEYIIPPNFISLINLRNLINSSLPEYIKNNMGDGTSSTVLNYRTGRLANSFSVTGLTQDRDGALTAFFTYMKYPYATFSRGGVQSSPSSRDPVLLGNKAIRDIAQEIIKLRLRAVGI